MMKERQNFKTYNLRDIRLMLGLTQDELAKLAGVASMYISLIENNKRTLTRQTAEKIAFAVSKLLSTEEEEVKISTDQLRASHIASFYPEHIQSYIGNLLYLTAQTAEGLEKFYEQKELPIAEQELYIKMEMVSHLASMLPQSEEPSVSLDRLERLVENNQREIEENKEKFLRIVQKADGSLGTAFQMDVERTIKKRGKRV